MIFRRKSSCGYWKLLLVRDHATTWFSGEDTSETRRVVRAAYTPRQVSRLIHQYITENIKIYIPENSDIVIFARIYTGRLEIHHFRFVPLELQNAMAMERAVYIASLERYCNFLEESGHTELLTIFLGLEMKSIAVKSAEHIFRQPEKEGSTPKGEVLYMSVVDLSDIDESFRYYGGICAEHIVTHGNLRAEYLYRIRSAFPRNGSPVVWYYVLGIDVRYEQPYRRSRLLPLRFHREQ